MTVRSIILLTVFFASTGFAADRNQWGDRMKQSSYISTSFTETGVAIQTFCTESGLAWEAIYQNTKEGTSILIGLLYDQGSQIDLRQNPELVAEMRHVLGRYLKDSKRNERASIDVMSALLILEEPDLHLANVIWRGSRA